MKSETFRFVWLGLGVVSSVTHLNAADYVLLDLGGQQGTFSEVNGMNKAGVVVGQDGQHAVVYDYGVITDLGTPEGTVWSDATDINDAGVIVGNANASSGTDGTRGFVYQDGEFSLIPTLGGNFSAAYGLNNLQQVVGASELEGGFENVAISYNPVTQDLTILDTREVERRISQAQAINDAGLAVGTILFEGGNHAAQFWPGGEVVDLETLAGNQSGATDINSRGVTVGESKYDPSLARFHAFLYDVGNMIDLGSLSDFDSRALGINDRGEIVGYSLRFGSDHAFVYHDGELRDLNDFVVVGGFGWTLTRATAINFYGQIAGQGTYRQQIHAFLLTPIAIHIERLENNLKLSWSEMLTDYHLQNNDDLTNALGWADSMANPIKSNHRWEVVLSSQAQSQTQFYRLAGP